MNVLVRCCMSREHEKVDEHENELMQELAAKRNDEIEHTHNGINSLSAVFALNFQSAWPVGRDVGVDKKCLSQSAVGR